MVFSFKRSGFTALLLLALGGCGGGSDAPVLLSGSSGQTNNTTGNPTSNTTNSTTDDTSKYCNGTANLHCSGNRVLRTDNGISVTAYGVQSYGTSTNDLLKPNTEPSLAYGLAPGSGGLAEVRLQRDANGAAESLTLMLSGLGLSWDGKTERPPILESFANDQGRMQLDAKGNPVLVPLPNKSDLSFFDYATKGATATQSNYANNIFHIEGPNCAKSGQLCIQYVSNFLQTPDGDWHTGGEIPDGLIANRMHSDGDPLSDGLPISLKGFRNYHHWNYGYANLGSWITQDLVQMGEWGGSNEHNKLRRGFIAFGPVTPPAQIPTTGTVRYKGSLRGWFGYQKYEDVYPIYGEVELLVDFAKRTAQISFTGTRLDEAASMDSIPVALKATATIGSSDFANYFTASTNNDTLQGGLGARFFGPVKTGGSGTGPAEVGGSFTMDNSASGGKGMIALGGFLLRKQ